MKKHESEFNDWFEAQFGKKPCTYLTRDTLKRRIALGNDAQEILGVWDDYDLKKQLALYAWNAARKECK